MSRLKASVNPVSAVKKVAMTTRPTTKLRFWNSDGSMTGWALRRSDQTNSAKTHERADHEDPGPGRPAELAALDQRHHEHRRGQP